MKTAPTDTTTVKFEGTLEYRSKSDPPTSYSRVVGTNAPSGPEHPHHGQTRYKWRGKGWRAIASARCWQVLGCSADLSAENDRAWAVTFSDKSLFTPAGLSVYARTAHGVPAEVLHEIVERMRALGGEVAKLADGLFEIERSAGAGAGAGAGVVAVDGVDAHRGASVKPAHGGGGTRSRHADAAKPGEAAAVNVSGRVEDATKARIRTGEHSNVHGILSTRT